MARLVLEVQSDQAEKALRLLKRHMKEVGLEGSVVQEKFSGLERRSLSLGRAFTTLGAAVGAIGLGYLIRESVQAQIQFERFAGALRVATGSAEGARQEMDFIVDTAQRLGLPLLEAAGSYSKLAAAAKDTALEGEVSRDVFTAVSEAATVLNLSAEQTGGALTALEQIISKGKVSAEELRGQLGERLPGAFQIAARSIGVTTAELDKMLSTGKLTAEQLLPAFAAELRKTFGPEVPEAANNLQSQLNKLNNAATILKATVGQELAPAIGDLATTLRDLAEDPAALQFAENFGMVIAKVVEGVAWLIRELGELEAEWRIIFAEMASILADFYRKIADFFLDIAVSIDSLPEGLIKLSPALENLRAEAATFGVSFAGAANALDEFAESQEQAAADAIKVEMATVAAGDSLEQHFTPQVAAAGAAASKAADDAKKFIESLEAASLRQFVDTVEEAAEGLQRLGTEMLDVSGIDLTAGIQLPSAEEMFGSEGGGFWDQFKDFFKGSGGEKEVSEALAESLAGALATALTMALRGEDWESIGSAVGGAIGATIGGIYGGPGGAAAGGAFGSLTGGLLGGLFDPSEKEERLKQAYKELVDTVRSSMPAIRQEVIDTIDTIVKMLNLMNETGQMTAEVTEAINREFESVTNSLLGIVPEDFGDRLAAAGELISTITTLPAEVQEAFEGLDLSSFADQLIREFMGVTADSELASLESTFRKLRDAIAAAGLSADDTAAKLRTLKDAYRDSVAALRADALMPLLEMMQRYGVFEAESRAKQAELMRFQAQLELKVIEAELTALGVMDATIRGWIDALRGAIASFDFGASLPGVPGGMPDAPNIPAGGGRRNRRRERRRQRRRDREQVRDFLAQFELSDFEYQLRNINKQFDEMVEKAHGNVNLERRLQEAREQAIQELTQQLYEPLRELRASLSQSGMTPAELFGSQQAEFFQLAGRVRAGDTDAIQDLAEAGADYRDAIMEMFGGTRAGRELLEEMDEILGGILGDSTGDPVLDENKRQTGLLTDIRDALTGGAGGISPMIVPDGRGGFQSLTLSASGAERFAETQRQRLIERIEQDNKTTHQHLIDLIEEQRKAHQEQKPISGQPKFSPRFIEPPVGGLT